MTKYTPLTLLLALVLLSGCAKQPDHPVIIVLADTLRADHLGCYGYGRGTSPAIDRFSRQAVRYSRAMASAPWTVPSHASLFTGMEPHQHGARTFKIAKPGNNVNPLPQACYTLAEALRKIGPTAAFMANVVFLTPRWQFNQGFDTYVNKHLPATELNQDIFSWLDSHRDKPFFLFVNYMDCHRPYNTTPHKEFMDPPAPLDANQSLDLLRRQVMSDGVVPPDLVQTVRDQYDTAVYNLDLAFSRLIDKLHKLGIYDRSLIIFTSDHGEYFGEHLLVEHSKDIYQPCLHIPLLVKKPGQRTPSVDDTPISLVDVPYLVVSTFSGSWAKAHKQRFPRRPGSHPLIAENYYTRAHDLFHQSWGPRFNRVRRAIYQWPYKLILSSDQQHELYHLDQDPGETDNLIHRDNQRVVAMAEILAAYLQSNVPVWTDNATDITFSQKELQLMKTLGYLD